MLRLIVVVAVVVLVAASLLVAWRAGSARRRARGRDVAARGQASGADRTGP